MTKPTINVTGATSAEITAAIETAFSEGVAHGRAEFAKELAAHPALTGAVAKDATGRIVARGSNHHTSNPRSTSDSRFANMVAEQVTTLRKMDSHAGRAQLEAEAKKRGGGK